jgi:hypothetical protein
MSLWTLTPLVAVVLHGAHPGPASGQGPVLAWLDGSLPLIVTSGTLIAVEQGDLLEPDPPDENKPAQQKPSPHQKVRAQLAESAVAKLTTSAPVKATSTGGEWVVLPPAAEPLTVELPRGTEVVLASGQQTELKQLAEVALPVGAAARIPAGAWDILLAVVRAEGEEDEHGSTMSTTAGTSFTL